LSFSGEDRHEKDYVVENGDKFFAKSTIMG